MGSIFDQGCSVRADDRDRPVSVFVHGSLELLDQVAGPHQPVVASHQSFAPLASRRNARFIVSRWAAFSEIRLTHRSLRS